MSTALRFVAAARVGAAAAALALVGCSGGDDAPPRPATSTTLTAATALPDPQPTPRPRLSDAVRDFLAAEQRSDRAASFLLLSRQSRVEYPDVDAWLRRRQELPAVTGFRIEGDGDQATSVVAVVEHEPGLDPFRGLSPAREKQTFTGRQEAGGFLVDGDPGVELILPPEAKAADATAAWVAAVQACDQPRAGALQAVSDLFGSAQGAVGLCGKAGPITPGAVGRLAPGIASTDIVAQYSTDALRWARVVRLTSPAAFGVVLAPIGDEWKVLGLTD